MARKKKAEKAVKRKPTKTPERERILQYKNWKSGDFAWSVPYGETKAFQFELIEFYPTDNIEPAVSAMTLQAAGGYRTLPISLLEETKAKAKAKWLSLKNKK
jgi:hypothetical protein